MPRQARKESKSGIYHVMLRGINRQQIFEDEEDQDKFLQVLSECKAISGFELYAYCLMGNHVHLLMKAGNEPLDLVFKRIGSRYVYWYNWKYARTGHLFQDRYKSEPVEDDTYFLTVLRYILQNPVKAGICQNLSDYTASSYHDYADIDTEGLTDTTFALRLLDWERLIGFLNTPNEDQCMDFTDGNRVSDMEAKAMIETLTKCKNVAQFQALDAATRNQAISILKEQGLSIRQISRLTGTSFNIVRKF